MQGKDKKPKTPPSAGVIRPVCREVNLALGENQLPRGAFNFGLYFNKWFFTSSGWKCQAGTGRGLEDNLQGSLTLFNERGGWDRRQASQALKARHEALEKCAQSLKELGYELSVLEARLETPLILGLGDEHPTEKGFRFDWNLGIPFIPASSLKGVVRLAWLVNHLNQLEQEDAEAFAAKLTNEKLEEAKRLPLDALCLFGCGGDNSHRGRVIFLDAYPKTLPRLKAEIMTCHYRDYYEGKRGPTEDQQPNPQKFWAVDPYVDEDQKQPLTFVFRLLLAPEVAQNAARKESLLQALQAALKEHGLGAKTAIGHGRFQEVQLLAPGGPPITEKKPPKPEQPPTAEVWERARLSWEPGPARLTASSGTRKAFLNGRAAVQQLLPSDLFEKVVKKRKVVEARVTVEDFKIIKVEHP